MSTIFLVRLRRERRYIGHMDLDVGMRHIERHPKSHAFSTKSTAEQFALTALPSVNPFWLDYGLYADEQGFYFSDYGEQTLSETEFFATLEAEGIAVPEWWDDNGIDWWKDNAWKVWWERLRRERTPQAREALRKRLGLPNWGENPFLRAAVGFSEDTIHLGYCLPYQLLYELAQVEVLPEMPPTHAGLSTWKRWWDENAPRLTDDQKAALWHLLDPQPWEIVEVELEHGR